MPSHFLAMLTQHDADAVVVLNDHSVKWFADLTEVFEQQPLANVETLAINMWPKPRGVMLATIGRLNVEYPGMHKVAVLESHVDLPVMKYLAGCGIDLICADSEEEGIKQLASVVKRAVPKGDNYVRA